MAAEIGALGEVATEQAVAVLVGWALPGAVWLDFDGWTFPRSGVAFVWTLASESGPIRGMSAQR